MFFWTIIKLTLSVLLLWAGLASLIAGIRLAYRPLLYQAILLVIMTLPYLLERFVLAWQPWYATLIFIPMLILTVFGLGRTTRAYLEGRGIGWRELLLFRPL